MKTEVFTSINDVPADEWDSIVSADRLICRHEYLSAVEASRINDCRYFYPVVYDGGRIIAHACLYLISTELDTFAKGVLKDVIVAVRKLVPGFLVMRSMECGTPVALGNTISIRPDVDHGDVLDELTRKSEELAREHKVRLLLFRDFRDSELASYEALAQAGYRRLGNLPTAEMEIRWGSFEEYLGSLRSSYRHKIRTRMKAANDTDVSFEVLTEFSDYAEDLVRLWRNAYEHATEYRREVLTKEFFENIDRRLGEDSAIILAKVNGEPAGFALLLSEADRLIWLFCGLSYEHNNQYSIYFNIIYRIIEFAIEGRYTSVEMGITTMIPKLDVGSAIVPLHMYMRYIHPVLNRVVPRLFDAMTATPELVPRHAFK